MHYDVVIVGAGPAGLATAIRLKQKAKDSLTVAVVEKAAEVGGHILSGAVMDPCGLNELIADWSKKGAPVRCAVTKDRMLYLTRRHAVPLPTPSFVRNEGNYIISLGELCRWLATQAEELGVDIFPGFAASDAVFNDKGHMSGIVTGVMGIGKDGTHTERYQEGIELHAQQIVLAEGARGSLTKKIIAQFKLDQNADPQTYGIGIKELWEIKKEKHQQGFVTHTVGWPLDSRTYGGSFLYHMNDGLLACGFVVALDYHNPWMSPFEEFQRFKTHPSIRPLFENGRRVAYGARALTEGGWQSLPQLSFPNGLLVGCAAGMVNVPRIKGSHNAIRSGILAADCILKAARKNQLQQEITQYDTLVRNGDIGQELRRVRNVRPFFRYGLWAGMVHAAVDGVLLRGRAPWTLHHHPDNKSLTPAAKARPITYPKADGIVTFDRLSSLPLAGVAHEDNQPAHLTLTDEAIPIKHNLALYDAPEQRYCPANVYEIITPDGKNPTLQINAQNCVHCKSCDIKDPLQNIQWVTPEGGGGPNYPNM